MRKNSDLITSLQASQILGFTQAHLRRLILQGKIKAEKFGNVWVMQRSALQRIQRLRKAKEKEAKHGSDQ